MIKNAILLLSLPVLTLCTVFYASPLMRGDGKSSDAADAMKQAAQILNVDVPATWSKYMNSPVTTGSTDTAQVGSDTIDSVMASWPIPNEFRTQAVQSVKLLVLAATEGSYTAQAFVFNIPTGTLLSTLLIVVTKLDSPTDPNSPVVIAYVEINSNAAIKWQYTSYTVKVCPRCGRKLWIGRCCHDETRYALRGNTPEELLIIKRKMIADQFVWFNQQPLNKMVQRYLSSQNDNIRSNTTLMETIEKYLSDNTVKAEILAPYNDSVLSALQSHVSSLKLSSQVLKMAKVASKNLPTMLASLARDYDFEDIINNPGFLQLVQTGRFSYENLFTFSTDNLKTPISIKYIWLLGQNVDHSTYSINFLFVNITSQVLIDTLLSNDTNTNETIRTVDTDKQIQIKRLSTLNEYGRFSDESLLSSITPWNFNTTKIVLNFLRFATASALIPQKHRMLSQFNSEMILLDTNSNQNYRAGLKGFLPAVIALSEAVSAVANAWKDIASAFRTTSSTTITKIVRFGFKYFSQKSTILQAINVPANRATEFINAVVIDYDLPRKGSFALGLEYSDQFAWDRVEFLYSPASNGIYRSLTLLKNGDSLSNTASFVIIDVNADWQLAPDLLLIHKSKSYLGGIFAKDSQSIEEVPHALTMDEAVMLQQFFMIIAMGTLAPRLGLNVTIPI